jgi:hypothetical protein
VTVPFHARGVRNNPTHPRWDFPLATPPLRAAARIFWRAGKAAPSRAAGARRPGEGVHHLLLQPAEDLAVAQDHNEAIFIPRALRLAMGT